MLKKIYWFSGTHWDREWHRTFEGFRCRLVDMIDRAVECVENVTGYGSFLLDGQSIILTDYLEARPERAELIGRLLREEKLFAGPFYVLQDEMVEDGELFVRNLQKGIALANEHGGRRFIGYSTDSFGHCAQLPQLLKLAGVDSMVFSRAFVGKQQDYVWTAPDGSEVLFIWLPLGNGGGSHQDLLDGGRHFPEDRKEALAAFERYLERLKPYVQHEAVLIADAADHISADAAAVRLMEDFNAKHPAGPHFQMISPPDAIRQMAQGVRPGRVRGEIRMSGPTVDGWLLPGTYSTRMPLKHGMSVLTRRLLGLEKLLTLLPWSTTTQSACERAWDQLLRNIPHDSICGCHIDEVYVENVARLNNARSIIDYLYEKALRGFSPVAERTASTPVARFYDPAPEAQVYKPFVMECPYPCIEDSGRVNLSAEGVDVALSAVERYPTHLGHLATYRIKGFYRNRTGASVVDVAMRTDAVRSAPASNSPSLPPLSFADGGDAGDSYNYSPPAEDQIIHSAGLPQRAVTRQLNDQLVQMQAEVLLAVPAGLSENRRSRTPEQVDLRIRYEVTWDRASGLTWISGSVYNLARDHRLRLVLPVPAGDTHSYSGAPFHIERRPVALDLDFDSYSERPLTDYPFVDYIRYGGLSVYSQSNGEYQITPRGIEITLCRCVGWIGRPDLAYRKAQAGPFYEIPMAQLLNTEIPFAYVVAPTLADPTADYLRKNLLGPTAIQCILADSSSGLRKRLPFRAHVAELTALRRLSEGQIELRLFNPYPETTTAQLELDQPYRKMEMTDLNHVPLSECPAAQSQNTFDFTLRPFQVLTLVATELPHRPGRLDICRLGHEDRA